MVIYSENLPTKARNLDDHDSNMWTDEDAVPLAGGGREFVMDKDKSASFVSYVKYTITQAAMHISLDDMRTYVEKGDSVYRWTSHVLLKRMSAI